MQASLSGSAMKLLKAAILDRNGEHAFKLQNCFLLPSSSKSVPQKGVTVVNNFQVPYFWNQFKNMLSLRALRG